MTLTSILPFLREAFVFYLWFNLFLLFGFAFNRFAGYLVRDWPSVTGTVTSSSVPRRTRAGSHGARSSSAALIIYTYEVNGETYTNQSIAPGFSISGSEADMVKRFPVGAQVSVYHSPTSPSISFLSKRSLIEPYLLTYFIVGNLLMPFIALFIHWMKSTFFNF
jgi:hypothetical protein